VWQLRYKRLLCLLVNVECFFNFSCESLSGLAKEPLEIARDVAKKLLESHDPKTVDRKFPALEDSFDFPLIVGV